MDEQMVCRLKALVRETWPERFTARPKLTLVGAGTKDSASKRPPIFALGPIQSRRHTASG